MRIDSFARTTASLRKRLEKISSNSSRKHLNSSSRQVRVDVSKPQTIVGRVVMEAATATEEEARAFRKVASVVAVVEASMILAAVALTDHLLTVTEVATQMHPSWAISSLRLLCRMVKILWTSMVSKRRSSNS